MPDLTDFEALSLEGMELDDGRWSGSRIVYNFGGGYRAKVVTAPAGLYTWRVSSGCLPGDEAYGNLIDNLPRFDYYLEFFQRHTTGGSDIFEITFRGKRYHAAFDEPDMPFEVFSSDLFGGSGVTINQCKVPGIVYAEDGSILEIENIPGLWSWHRADTSWTNVGGVWGDVRDTGTVAMARTGGSNILLEAAAQNGRDVLRFNSAANDSFFVTNESPTVFDMFLVMRMRESAFSNDCGLVSTDAAGAVAVLLGDSGETKFQNIAISDFEYRLDGSTYAQSNQQAPMNRFGVVHLRFLEGFTLENLQFGKDRGTAGTFAELDLAEIIIVEDALLSTALMQRVTAYLVNYWDTV